MSLGRLQGRRSVCKWEDNNIKKYNREETRRKRIGRLNAVKSKTLKAGKSVKGLKVCTRKLRRNLIKV